MQISYHSTLTKIQKLQQKKGFFLYFLVRPVLAGNAQNWPVWPVHGWYAHYLNWYEMLVF